MIEIMVISGILVVLFGGFFALLLPIIILGILVNGFISLIKDKKKED